MALCRADTRSSGDFVGHDLPRQRGATLAHRVFEAPLLPREAVERIGEAGRARIESVHVRAVADPVF